MGAAPLYCLFGYMYMWPKLKGVDCGKVFLKLNAIYSTCVLSLNENNGNILQSVGNFS